MHSIQRVGGWTPPGPLTAKMRAGLADDHGRRRTTMESRYRRPNTSGRLWTKADA